MTPSLLGWTGRLAGPPLAAATYAGLTLVADDLSPDARLTAALAVLMAVLWATEAMPLAATALLPAALLPVAGVLPFDEVASSYASEVVFLLLGGFCIAQAMQRWNLHRRIALRLVLMVGTREASVVAGFMITAAGLSMWISNTATAAMMIPIATGLIGLTYSERSNGDTRESAAPEGKGSRFPACLLLAIAFGASIGSVGTLIGTPPNLILRGILESRLGIEIGFAEWMLVGVPLVAAFVPLAWFILVHVIHRLGSAELPGGHELIGRELRDLGPMSRGEWTVAVVFAATVLAWVGREPLSSWSALTDALPWIENLSDAGIALIAALLLFAIPVDAQGSKFALDWKSAKAMPWGVLVLIGGGLALATAIASSGLDAWIGAQVGDLDFLPTIVVVAATALLVTLLSNFASNTATAATLLPILAGVGVGIGVDPMLLMLPAALAASYAFMLPAATPPNAIAFGSGHLTVPELVRAGVLLNLIAIPLIVLTTYTLGSWVFGFSTG
jgi:solute carrier family 13 (sodium-dependent dicarboxylate transporter), member 2/3/5